jgi:Tfp pilus assembly protein PilF
LQFFRSALSALVFFSFCVPAYARKENPWAEVRSPHFRVLTDGGEGAARRVALEFEQVRAVFATSQPNMRLETGTPLLIFAPKDEYSMKHLSPFRWKKTGGMAQYVGGYFQHGWERQFAVIRLDQDPSGDNQVVYHEYTHTLLHANVRWLPIWLDEGLADYYGGTRVESSKVYVGAPIKRVMAMRWTTPIPLEELISVNPHVKYKNDEQRINLFYAESWALVHYCTFGEGMEQGKKLALFFQKIQKGEDQKKSFVETLGSFEDLQKKLDVYVHKFLFMSYVMKNPPQIDEKAFASRKMSVAETEAAIGGYRIWDHDTAGARELIQDALQEDPKLAEAHEAMGFLDFQEGKDEEALKEFTTAYETDSSLYLARYFAAMLSPFARSEAPDDQVKLRAALREVVKANPQFAEAYVQLAMWFVRQGESKTAFGVARRAEELEPSRAGYHTLSARLLHQMGRDKEAADLVKFVADRWQGPDHDEAMEVWKQLPEESRPSVEADILSIIANAGSVTEGKLQSVSCAKQGEETKITISLANGKTQTFQAKGPYQAGFSDTIWYGTDHFSLCHHLEGLRTIVHYKPEADKETGEITRIEFRVDLPEPAKEKVPDTF